MWSVEIRHGLEEPREAKGIQLHCDKITAKSQWQESPDTTPPPPPSGHRKNSSVEAPASLGLLLWSQLHPRHCVNQSISKTAVAAMEPHWNDKYLLENNVQVRHNWNDKVLLTSFCSSLLKRPNQLGNFIFGQVCTASLVTNFRDLVGVRFSLSLDSPGQNVCIPALPFS